MLTTSRRRRFVPSLDRLQSRLVLSGPDVVITPMDPVLIGWDNPPSDVLVTPMDPVLIGWECDTLVSDDSLAAAPPVGVDSTLAAGGALSGP